MDIHLIRHGRAEPRAGGDDAARALTAEGSRRLRRALLGAKRIMSPPERIMTSPYLRARQTASALQEIWGVVPESLPALGPGGGAEAVVAWLSGVSAGRVVLVGHAPDLGRLAAYLLCGRELDFLPLKKGGLCSLRSDDGPRPGGVELRWLLTPSQLQSLAKP